MKQSKPIVAALGLVLGLLIGLAIGASVSRQQPDSRPRTDADTSAGNVSHNQAPLLPEPKRDSSVAPEQPVGRDPAPTITLADLLKSAEIPPVPSGPGEITGTVLTQAGTPLAGVEVSAAPEYPEDSGYKLPTAEERLAARMRMEKWSDAARRSALTDAEGRYRLTNLDEELDYNLGAKLAGWKIDFARLGRYRFRAGSTCDFTARVSLEFAVTVLMPDGSPARSAEVRATQRSGGSSRSGYARVKNGTGELSLEEGPWNITAEAGEYGEYQSEPISIEIKAGEQPPSIILQLKAKPGIVGSVSQPSSIPQRAATVYLMSNPPAEPPVETFKESPRGAHRGSSGNPFQFIDLVPGRYRLLLVFERRVVDWRDVEVADGLMEISLTLPEPQQEDYIVVRVLDPEGKPLTNVRINVSRTIKGSGDNINANGPSSAQPDGSYWVSRRLFGTIEPGSEGWYDLEVSHPTYGRKRVRYGLNDTQELLVSFLTPATLVLTVDNFNDHPLRDKLHWRLSNGGASHGARGSSPLKVGPVEPGEYTLSLTYQEDWSDQCSLYSQSITLNSGENELSLLVPVLHTLTIELGEVQASNIHVQGKASPFRFFGHRAEAKNGTLVIEAVPAGSYSIRSANGSMNVTVNADTEVKFEPRPFDCFVLTIEPGSSAETAGLRSGDKLIAVDGEELEDVKLLYARAQGSFAGDNTTWTVLRDGIRTEVAFNAKELLSADSRRGIPGLRMETGHRLD